MNYFLVGALAMIGPFFWPLNNGIVFAAAIASKTVNPYGAALAIGFGSTLSFIIWYGIGRFSRNISPKWQAQMDRIDLKRYRGSTALLSFLGALCSLPPLTPVALLLGSTQGSFKTFSLFALLGRSVRYLGTTWFMVGAVEYFSRHQYFDWLKNWFV